MFRKLITGNTRQTNKLNVPFMKITTLIFNLSTDLHYTAYPFPLQVHHYFYSFHLGKFKQSTAIIKYYLAVINYKANTNYALWPVQYYQTKSLI